MRNSNDGGPDDLRYDDLSAGGNYTIALTGVDFQVTPRDLTITAAPRTRKYGYANPALIYLLGGDGLWGSDRHTTVSSRVH